MYLKHNSLFHYPCIRMTAFPIDYYIIIEMINENTPYISAFPGNL